MFGVTCTCSWLELFVVIWSWVKNDAAPFLGVGGLVGGYVSSVKHSQIFASNIYTITKSKDKKTVPELTYKVTIQAPGILRIIVENSLPTLLQLISHFRPECPNCHMKESAQMACLRGFTAILPFSALYILYGSDNFQ